MIQDSGADYRSSRQRFLAAATQAGAELQQIPHPLPGPAGEALYTDVAWLGATDASRVFVMVSGTHGVEGICGSGAQAAWLERGEAGLFAKAGIAVMLVHAINPHGFAWLRRVTQENVDLNRNWVDFDAPLPDGAAYAEVADLVGPSSWDETARERVKAGIGAFVAKRGVAALAQAISGGQHSHPLGLFYGGQGPTWSRITLTALLVQRLVRAERVGFIDLHSGLGPPGFGEIMVTADAEAPSYLRARQWHGAAVTPVGSGPSASARIAGDWLGAVPALLPQAQVTGIALEFGTIDMMGVLFALIGDHWLHAHGDLASPAAAAIRQQMRRAFYTDDDTWRGMVLGQVLAASRAALRGLAAS